MVCSFLDLDDGVIQSWSSYKVDVHTNLVGAFRTTQVDNKRHHFLKTILQKHFLIKLVYSFDLYTT